MVETDLVPFAAGVGDTSSAPDAKSRLIEGPYGIRNCIHNDPGRIGASGFEPSTARLLNGGPLAILQVEFVMDDFDHVAFGVAEEEAWERSLALGRQYFDRTLSQSL